MPRFEWEADERLLMAQANYMACAYNAAVNYGSGRAAKKMGDLVRAINYYERIEGVVKLDFLVAKGVIDGYTACADGCEMRPGGLFHGSGCENDSNHPVSKARRAKAREMLPERQTYAADVSLVGGCDMTDDRTALEKLGHRVEEGRKVWSVPIPEPRSKVRAVRKPRPIRKGRS